MRGRNISQTRMSFVQRVLFVDMTRWCCLQLAIPVQTAYLRNKKFEVINPGQNPVIDAKSNVHAGM